MNNLFIDCSLGVSGDMLLAAFIDLGVPLDVIHRPLKILELEEAYSLIVEESKSFSLRGIKVSVKEKDSNEKCEEICDELIKSKTKDSYVYYMKGWLLNDSEKYSEAIVHFLNLLIFFFHLHLQ